MTWRHLLKSQKYWNGKVLLDHHNTAEFLVCVVLLVLLVKWAQLINFYQRATLGGPMTKQFALQSCFLCIT